MKPELQDRAVQKNPANRDRMRLIWDPGQCVGCRVCEAVCSFVKEGESNPVKSRGKIVRSVEDNILYKVRVHCQQCVKAYCKAVCPSGAINEDEGGVKSVDEKKCVGCRMCEIACPIGAITVNPDTHVSMKCDLCRGLDEPQCAKYCYAGALQHVSQEKAGMMVARARAKKMMDLHPEAGLPCP
jgi:Fe-S-cluster-containing hydrogenase component 2